MTNSKRLIVNADGFGFGPGATQGIIDAVRQGRLITSVSINANFPDAERVRELVREFPHISVGVHLNPMAGRPCLKPKLVPSLVGSNGFFHEGPAFSRLLRKGSISLTELESELDAQIGRARELAGDRLTHVDSQENRHLQYFDLFLRLARKWNLQRMRSNAPVICLESDQPRLSRLKAYSSQPLVFLAHQYRRLQMWKARSVGMRMADDLVVVGYAGQGNKTHYDNWLRILRNLRAGTHEIYCHPAYPDDTLRRWAYYCEQRAAELSILCKPGLREVARDVGVEIVSFDSI